MYAEWTGRLTAPLLTLQNGDARVSLSLEQSYRRGAAWIVRACDRKARTQSRANLGLLMPADRCGG